ncbi:MAG: hypothetical protein KGJ73_04185, partial [Rhodospirillales bacterium]|nr:hypothetical protein [Rhodospirillales bacterium]
YDTYGYDAADRLTSDAGYSYTPSGGYTPLYTNNFTYNSNDFLLSGGYPSNLNPFLGSFTATPKSNSDEISSVTYTNSIGPTTYNYTYDADGNLVSDGANTYLWDAENRLIGINYASGGGTKFRYDGLNRRVAIIETVNGTSTETDYLWCGQKLCASYTPSGTVTARYMPQGEAQYSGSTQTNLYYQFDHLGSVIGVTDSAGNQKWTPQHGGYYSPWGLSLFQGSVTPTFQFAGMFYHGPSGLYLTLNRVYDPKTARWISRDPAGELFDPVGNLYTYVGGDPVNNIDPLGLAAPWAPYPPSNIPGGPWSPAPGQRPGAYYGPKQPSGGRPMCQYVPPGDQGGPPGSKGYWKTQQPGQKGWGQRYNQQGEPITPDEAHPGPSGSAPPEPASPTPEPSVPEVPEVPPIIEIP